VGRAAEAAAGGRVFGPAQQVVASVPEGTAPPRPSGPDLSLRPDLSRGRDERRETGVRVGVVPAAAAVYVDGNFVGTGRDLAAAVRPLTLAPGRHVLEAVAPGYRPLRREVELGAGEVIVVELALEREAGA